MSRSTSGSAIARIIVPTALLLALALSIPPAQVSRAVPPPSGPPWPGASIQFLRTTEPLSDIAKSAKTAPTQRGTAVGTFETEFADRPEEEMEAEGEGQAAPLRPSPGELPSSDLPLRTDPFTGPSWEGLNHVNNRYSDSGNQWSSVPPDQGLCVGQGRVLEVVNSVVQIYDTGGAPLLQGQAYGGGGQFVGLSLNQFFGEPSAFVRPSGPFGPNIFDPSCLYDAATQRWFLVSADLELDSTTGNYTGESGEFIAVSTSSDPLGTWNVWFLDTTNNGSNGTPNHNCSGGFCFGDYPQIGLDANTFSITTNEFALFGAGFKGAQLYVFSKADLVAGLPTPDSAYLEMLPSITNEGRSYSIIPVNSLPGSFDSRANGTQYYVMRKYTPRNSPATAIGIYALTNTASIDTGASVVLKEVAVKTQRMDIPWYSIQRKGPTPLIDCMNIGVDCYGSKVPVQFPPLVLASGGDRVGGAWMNEGVIYVTVATALNGQGAAVLRDDGGHMPIGQKVGVAYVWLRPKHPAGDTLGGRVVAQGYAGVTGADLSYPSVAVTPSGKGAIGVTLVGPDNHASAAYIPFTTTKEPNKVKLIAAGKGPSEDPFGLDYGGWQRWGDYSWTTVGDDGNLWIANEYIGQRCGFDAWMADSTCGWTRTYFANWSTRVSRIDG